MSGMATEFADKWAILFGCKEYENKDLATLDYPINDVRDLAQVLHQQLEFPQDHFLDFGEGLTYVPEYSTFWDQLGTFLKQKPIGEQDLLLFYFTGHGFRQGRDYLLPQKASLNNLKRTGIAVDDVVEELVSGSSCKNIVMLLDACRNPPKGAKGEGTKGIGDQSAALMEKHEVLCFFSCQPEEQSWEIDDLQHGSFTWCVLEAIRGAKCITAAELDEYLVTEVPLLNQKHQKAPQKPYAKIVPHERGKLPILASKVRRQQTANEYDAMIQRLLDLSDSGRLPERYYEAAVELLLVVRDQEREISAAETRKLAWIVKVCGGRIKPRVFTATWDALERQTLPVTAPPTTLAGKGEP